MKSVKSVFEKKDRWCIGVSALSGHIEVFSPYGGARALLACYRRDARNPPNCNKSYIISLSYAHHPFVFFVLLDVQTIRFFRVIRCSSPPSFSSLRAFSGSISDGNNYPRTPVPPHPRTPVPPLLRTPVPPHLRTPAPPQ